MIKFNGYLNFVILTVWIGIIKSCLTDVNITYLVRNYRNPNNLDDRLKKCESLDLFGDHCDPLFHFTSYTYTDQWQRRSIFHMQAGPILNSKFVDNVMEAYEIQRVFPDAVEIELDIEDSDVDENQRIARFRRQIPLETKGKHELKMGVDVQVEVVINIECAAEYYGERCETYCVPLNGLWECDPKTGTRLCMKQCKNGHCELTSTGAICACPIGWSGDSCQTQLHENIIASLSIPELPMFRETQPFEKIRPHNPKYLQTIYRTTTTTREVTTRSKLKEKERTKTLGTVSLETKSTTISSVFCSNCSNPTFDNETVITSGTGKTTTHDTRNVWIPITISICTTLWVFGIVLASITYYRRRKRMKTKIRQGTVWTNSVYGLDTFGHKRPFSVEFTKSSFNSEITQPRNQFSLSLNRPSQRSVLRNASTLPRIPNETINHRPSIRYVRPVGRGSNRLRFGSVTVAPFFQDSFSTSSVQSGLTIPECLMSTTDTYEEVNCTHQDYSTNEPESKMLTSFQ